MKAKRALTEVGSLVIRYAGASLVTFLVSASILLLGRIALGIDMVSPSPHQATAAAGLACTAALAGVFLGSLCLAGHGRGLACMALTVIGLAFYYTFWDAVYSKLPTKHGHISPMGPLALGGLCALCVTFLTGRCTKKANALNLAQSSPK